MRISRVVMGEEDAGRRELVPQPDRVSGMDLSRWGPMVRSGGVRHRVCTGRFRSGGGISVVGFLIVRLESHLSGFLLFFLRRI